MQHPDTSLAVLLFAAAAIAATAAFAAAGAQGEPQAAPSPSGTLVIPDAEKSRKNPVPAVPEAVESGKGLFASQCAMCHGAKADGRGDLARQLKLSIPNLADPQRQKKRTDGEWFYIIGRGHQNMPAEKRLVDQQKWEIVLYLRSLLKDAPAR
jgi:mono/diheme cytochrome c family protein